MKPDESTIARFKEAYEKEYGGKITDQEAFEAFSHLANVVRILTSHIRFSDLDTPDGGDTLAPGEV